jgi:hypothetical protein
MKLTVRCARHGIHIKETRNVHKYFDEKLRRKWIIVNSMKIQDEMNLVRIGATGCFDDSFERSDTIIPDKHLPK